VYGRDGGAGRRRTGVWCRRQGGHRPLSLVTASRPRRSRPTRHVVLGGSGHHALGDRGVGERRRRGLRPQQRPARPQARLHVPPQLQPAGRLRVPLQAASGRPRRSDRVRHAGQPQRRPRLGAQAQRDAPAPHADRRVPGQPQFPHSGDDAQPRARRSVDHRRRDLAREPRASLHLCRLAEMARPHRLQLPALRRRRAPLPARTRPLCGLSAGDGPVQQRRPHPAGAVYDPRAAAPIAGGADPRPRRASVGGGARQSAAARVSRPRPWRSPPSAPGGSTATRDAPAAPRQARCRPSR
jgi:hypothetical protein